MATLYIQEFPGGPISGNPIVKLPPLATKTLTISASSATSAAFGAGTGLIRVWTDTNCAIRVSPAASPPAAVATDTPVGAAVPEYFAVDPNSVLSAITI